MRLTLLFLLLTTFSFASAGEIEFNLGCPTLAMSGTDVSCYNVADGSATVTVYNVAGNNYSISWSNGENQPTIQNLAVGTYTVTVKDLGTGCTAVGAFVVGSPDPILLDEDITDVPCNGTYSGEINLSVIGGTPNYSFEWENSIGNVVSTNQNLTNALAGIYTVTVEDDNFCVSSKIYEITEPLEELNASYVATDALCANEATGSVDMDVWGGTPAYAYTWSNGATTQDVSGLPVGNYSVLIEDQLGCQKTISVGIAEPTALVGIMSSTDVLCYGDESGSVSVSASGGNGGYNYSWQHSNNLFATNNSTLSNVGAEDYQVTVTDVKGCEFIGTVTLFQPTLLEVTSIVSNVLCYGGTDGSVDISSSGGTFPYSFSWLDAQNNQVMTTEDLTNVEAGSYSFTLTDFNNCIYNESFDISQPQLPISVVEEVSDVLCFGENTGGIDLTVSGGTIPYAYSWNSGQISEDVSGLFTGNYIYTITDFNNCTFSNSVFIDEPTQVLDVTKIITDANCYGDVNGGIDLTVTGGTIDYSFQWSNSLYDLSDISEDLIDYPADSYPFVVTDGNGCLFIDTAIIGQPLQLETTLIGTNILCYGESTGSIDLTVTGGVLDYNYLWINGPVTEDVSNLPAGMYSVLVEDDHGCIIQDSIELTEPSAALSFDFDVSHVSCFDGSNGEIELQIFGGTVAYDLLWSSGDTLLNIDELLSAYYPFVIEDANGCILSDSIFVDQPDALTMNETINAVTCAGKADGTINISPDGGTPPYDYAWFNSTYALSTQDEDLLGFEGDTYQVEIIDSNGCFYEAFFEITEPDSLRIDWEVKGVTCKGDQDGEIYIDISGGNPSYYTNWSTGATTEDLYGIGAGFYQLIVTDQKNCTDTVSFDIIDPDTMIVQLTYDHVSCLDQVDGVAYAQATGGNEGFQYLWSDGVDIDIDEGLPTGWISIEVTDVLGCLVEDSIEITSTGLHCIDPVNTFTPNNDAYNDTWVIDNMDLYPSLEMKIFNKWGNVLNHQWGIYKPWDGKINGNDAPSGTYYYIIDVNKEGRDPITGTISIVR